MDPLEFISCVFFPKTTYVSTRVIACVFFPQTTFGSTSVHCMCVPVMHHLWISQWSLHVCSFPQPHMDPPVSLHVCSFHKPHMDQPVVIACVFFSTNHIWIHLSN